MKYKSIVGLIILSILSAMVFASNAPPPIPTEYWGRLIVDGVPAPDGTEVKYFDGTEWIITTTTEGWYNIILTGGDSDLTDPADPDCSAHVAAGEACIPCTVGVDCVEGPQAGDTVTLTVDGNLVNVEWGDSASSDENVITTYTLIPGWNLLSFPALPTDDSLTNLLTHIASDYSVVWTMISGVWKSSTQPFAPLADFDLDKSYYVYVTSVSPIQLVVIGIPQDSTTINLVPGWNLAGYPKVDSDTIADTLAGVDYQVVWTLVGGSWKSSTQPFAPLTHFVPGRGYFVYANSAHSYEVTI